MSEHNITVLGGSSTRLLTSGKYCDRDIVIEALAGGVELPELTTPGAAADLMAGKQMLDGEGKVVDGTFSITEEITEQDSLIEQIKSALHGKAAGGELPTQEKNVEITENGEVVVLPDDGHVLSKVSVSVSVESSGSTENLLDALLTNTLTNIDSDITSITSYACYNATKITSVNLPNVTSIGSNAFRACSGIKTFYAPKVTSLGTYAFYGCTGLTELNYQNISQVPSTCFYQCTAVTKADFGPKCKTLSGSSLAYCSRLDHLILRYTDGVVGIATNTFSGANFDGYVYVPSALLVDYEADSNWASYGGSARFRAIEDYPDICG